MIKVIIRTIFFVFVIGCVSEQSLYMMTNKMLKHKGNSFYYECYQTGFDNYKYNFYIKNNSTDSLMLGEVFVNDANFENINFESKVRNDTLYVNCNYPYLRNGFSKRNLFFNTYVLFE